ncbi:MAG: DUF2510 domain-containing protein [Coriobacteriia bacterium]|nr:DUF2510 domain-containing protein [Coriobacteriia bacterium]
MSRYGNTFKTPLGPEQARQTATQYLQGEGFKYMEERGEMVWRKGVGALANPQFIKCEVSDDGTVRIESWTAGVSLIPGVYGGELDPTQGAFGFAVKAALKPRIRELESRLGGTTAASGATDTVATTGAAGTAAAAWYPDPTGRHEMRYWDGAKWTADVADGGAAATDPEGVS